MNAALLAHASAIRRLLHEESDRQFSKMLGMPGPVPTSTIPTLLTSHESKPAPTNFDTVQTFVPKALTHCACPSCLTHVGGDPAGQ